MFIYSINSVRALQQDIVIKSGVFKPLSTKFLIIKKKKSNGYPRTMINKSNRTVMLGFEICLTFSQVTSENSKGIKYCLYISVSFAVSYTGLSLPSF